MRKFSTLNLGSILFFLTVSLSLSGTESAIAQVPEIEAIVNEVSLDSQKGALFNYSYQMSVRYKRNKFGGRRFSKVYEAILPSRFSLNRVYAHPLILIKDSEQDISEEYIRHSREEIAKEIEKAEKLAEIENDRPEGAKDGGYWTLRFSSDGRRIEVDILELLRRCRLANLHRPDATATGQIWMDFVPNPHSTFEKPLLYLSKIEGRIWIDAAAKRITRIEGFAPGTFAVVKDLPDVERQKEAVFLYEQTQMPEGFWFPHKVRFDFAKHPDIFDSFELEFDFSNYTRAAVDVQYQENKSTNSGTTPEMPLE
jgi:hypothetical protein